LYAGYGEPNFHLDNVAASVRGGLNLISHSPASFEPMIDTYDIPENLGLLLGLSDHQKINGTEGMRQLLTEPIEREDFVNQGGLIASTIAALVSDNVDGVLERIWGDRFHEVRRADAKGYGNFTFEEFQELRRYLFKRERVAMVVSGAGPNMLFL